MGYKFDELAAMGVLAFLASIFGFLASMFWLQSYLGSMIFLTTLWVGAFLTLVDRDFAGYKFFFIVLAVIFVYLNRDLYYDLPSYFNRDYVLTEGVPQFEYVHGRRASGYNLYVNGIHFVNTETASRPQLCQSEVPAPLQVRDRVRMVLKKAPPTRSRRGFIFRS